MLGGTAWLWRAVLVGWAGLGRRQAGVHGGGSRALHCPGPQAGGRPWSTCVPLPASSCGSFPASSAAPTSTSCRMTTGRPSRPGSTASASVGSSWCPPCSTLSPGRRATSGTCCPVHRMGCELGRGPGVGPTVGRGRQGVEFALGMPAHIMEHLLSGPGLSAHSVLPRRAP